MEEYKDNIDEFFKRSLDSFNDTPSEFVWEKIDSRLAAEVTIWSTIVTFIFKYIWVSILGSSLLAYHFYSQHKYNELIYEVELMGERYSGMESKLSSVNSKFLDLKDEKEQSQSYILQLEKEYANQQSKLMAFEAKLENLSAASNLNSSKKKTLLSRSSNTFFTLRKADNLNQYSNYIGNFLASANDGMLLPIKSNVRGTYSSNSDLTISEVKRRAILDGQSAEKQQKGLSKKDRALFIPSVSKGYDWKKAADEYNKSYLSMLKKRLKYVPVEIHEPIEPFAFRHRYGLNYSTINTITNSADKRNFGNSLGVVYELGLKKGWSITNALKYNTTNYEIDNGTNQLGIDDLSDVPGGSSFQFPVKVVEVRSQYLDFNMGLSKRFGVGKKEGAIFINPSVGWQFYFPQEYLFTFVNEDKTIYDERRFIGYFGTAKVMVGYEKSISEELQIQLGIYGEKTLVSQGRENRHRINVGISSSLFFGK